LLWRQFWYRPLSPSCKPKINAIRIYFLDLYYGNWDDHGNEALQELAFVISPNGLPIPPKTNDPEAPTIPGLYVREKRYAFVWSKLSRKRFSFQTKAIDQTIFSFHGRFGWEPFDDDVDTPFLDGELKELRNGQLIRRKRVHFGHAVVY